MTSAQPLLEISALTKSFGTTEVLKGIDLSVEASQLTFIIGPSGSGKSTLLRCVNRLEEPTSGRIVFDGIEVTAPSTDLNALRRRMGMVFQSFNLYPHMTALANVDLALRKVLGKPRAEAEAIARQALADVGLAGKEQSYPNELSGGQQQRVAIARALVHEPKLIICDEPTASLDAKTGHHALELLKRSACGPDRCVIVVTHDSRIFPFADWIAEMEDGRVVKSCPASDYHHA